MEVHVVVYCHVTGVAEQDTVEILVVVLADLSIVQPYQFVVALVVTIQRSWRSSLATGT